MTAPALRSSQLARLVKTHSRIHIRSVLTSAYPFNPQHALLKPGHQNLPQAKQYHVFPKMTSPQPSKKDWSATQYLKFNNERTRAVYDLVSQIQPHITSSTPRIYDLGCGPGNSTKVLLDAFPTARITGMDSSPDMLEKANAEFSNQEAVNFIPGDLATFKTDEKPDLLFSNAVFHWLRSPERIPTLVRLFKSLEKGSVLAIQVPDNYHEPSHRLMREVASQTHKPWSSSFSSTAIGDLSDSTRPDLDPIEPPSAFYNALIPHASHVNIWRTEYMHVLKGAGAIVEWVKATGLQPYLNLIKSRDGKKGFLKEYERKLKREYPELKDGNMIEDGNVLLGYPRLFVVAVRK